MKRSLPALVVLFFVSISALAHEAPQCRGVNADKVKASSEDPAITFKRLHRSAQIPASVRCASAMWRAMNAPPLKRAEGPLAPAAEFEKGRKQRGTIRALEGPPPFSHAGGNGKGKPDLSFIKKGGSSNIDLRALPQTPPEKNERPEREGPEITPGVLEPTVGTESLTPPRSISTQSLRLQTQAQAPAPTISFDGLDFRNWGAGHPPDTNGDVGPDYYIQTINTSIGIYRKSDGVRVAVFTFNTFMSQGHFGNLCDTNNFGDPVVLYDTFEDRWIITDFAFRLDSGGNVINPPGSYQCIAASKTSDPVSGGWSFYSINTAGGLGDYPKFGIWPDGLYMTANMFNYAASGGFQNPRLYAFNKAQMYAGSDTVQVLSFDLPADQFTVLPANARLQTGTPPAGTPNHYGSVWKFLNAIEIWDFHADWDNPPLSSVTGPIDSTMGFWWAQFRNGTTTLAPTPANSNDTLYPRLMMQNQYTNFGGAESLWATHTVGTGNVTSNVTVGQSAVRYYQVNVTGGAIAAGTTQSFTYSPDSTTFRYMPSGAVDRSGNFAIGYSTSNATSNPALKYAGRLAGDPANAITLTEQTLWQGTGAQTGNCGGAACTRWGDYSAMSLDPDGCRFWYTNMYYGDNSLFHLTRIGSFTLDPSCSPVTGRSGTLFGNVTDSVTSAPIAGATVTFGSRLTTTNGTGAYTFSNVPVGTYASLTATFPGYNSASATNLAISDSAPTNQNLALTASIQNGCTSDATQSDFQKADRSNVDVTSTPGLVLLSKPDVLDQQNANVTTSGFGFNATAWAGQTFRAGVSGQLTRADLDLFCSGCSGTTPNLTVSIRATTGTPALPTGADLATATIAGFNSGAGGYFTATFTTPLAVTAGTTYAVIVRAVSNPSPGTYAYVVSSANPYVNGQRVTSGNGGSTWAADTTSGGRDLGFKIYVNTGYSPSGTLVSSRKDANPATNNTPTWGTLSWNASTPAGTAVKFQIGASNSALGPFNFVGPDGTASTFFTTNNSSLAQFNGNRYLKYTAVLSSTNPAATPSLDGVTICFADNAPPILTAAAATGTYGGTATLSATLTASDGTTNLSGKTISFTVDSEPNPVGSATTVNGVATFNLNLATRNSGAHTYSAKFDGDNSYGMAVGSGTLSIGKATATIVVTPYHVNYDGNAHTATATATGINSEVLTGFDLSGTTHAHAGTYSADAWKFTNANYADATGTVTDAIDAVDATLTVNGYSVAYDGFAHTATGTATGVKGESLSGLELSATTHASAGDYSDTWSFTDATGNYNNASGSVSDHIGKATLTVSANNAVRLYSYPNPTFTASFSGFLNGDTLASVSGSPSLTTSATPLSVPGTYPITITAGSLSAANYAFKFVDGTLTIRAAGFIGLDRVSIGATKALTDSFSSSGGYPSTQGNNALVVSNGNIEIGGARINGTLVSSQGSVVLQPGTVVSGDVTAGAAITSNKATVLGNTSQNQPGAALAAPPAGDCGAFTLNPAISGGTFTYVSGDLTISGNGVSTLANGTYCFHNVAISGQARLQVTGPVSINVTGVVSVSGGGLVNATRVPANLQIASSYSAPAGVAIGGGPDAFLTVYAPATDVTISGNASYFGAILGKTLTLSGNPDAHFDTALPNVWSAFFGF